MSDWELVPDNKSAQTNQINQPESDWEVSPTAPNSRQRQSQEGLGMAAAKVIPRIGEDILRGGMNFLKNIPQYAESAKTEIPGVFSALKQHPGHALAQGAAGLAELGHNVLNTPRSIAEYGANRLNLLPQSFPEKIPAQKDISGDINQLFGQPKYPGEELIRGSARNALNLTGAGKLASVFNPANLTAKSIAKDIINTANKNKEIYSNRYNNLWKQAENKGHNDVSHIVDKIDYKTLKKYSPKESIEGVTDFVNNPSIQSAHNAKSDLLKIQRDLRKTVTKNTAQRKHSDAVNKAVDAIKNNMFKNEQGVIDKDLKNKYNNVQTGYRKEVVPYYNKNISEYKADKMSEKELVNALSKGEFMRKRGKFHPAMGIRKMILPGLSVIGGLGAAGLIYNNMMGNPPIIK
jgi:hypothetical protein